MTDTATRSGAANEMVFTAKDPTRTVVITLFIVSAVVVWTLWQAAYLEDAAGIVITAIVLAAMFTLGIFCSRLAARKRAVIDGHCLRLKSGSKAKVVDLNSVTDLYERRVKVGRHSYLAYFTMLQTGEEVQLFAKGSYKDEEALLSHIQALSGKRCEMLNS
jgi:hypothetical protein